MRDYSRPIVDFVELKFGLFIAKRLLNEKGMSSNIEFMPVANKRGQKVKKFFFITFFGKIQHMINKSGNKSLF